MKPWSGKDFEYLGLNENYKTGNGRLAQLVERMTVNHDGVSSSLTFPASHQWQECVNLLLLVYLVSPYDNAKTKRMVGELYTKSDYHLPYYLSTLTATFYIKYI